MRLARENLLIASLDDDERRRLQPFLETVELPLREVVAMRGETIEWVYFPTDAVLSMLLELGDGETVEVGLLGREGMSGLNLLFDVPTSTMTVIVQVPGGASRIAADDLSREVVRTGGRFYRTLLRYTNLSMDLIAQVGACNAVHGVDGRCARWILMAQDRAGRDEFPMTHEFLSMMLGVRRASVSASANALRGAGAIAYDRGRIAILDRGRLLKAACGCYASISATITAAFPSLR